MNTATPPFNNIHVRRAIAYATDGNGILKALFPNGSASRPASIAPNASFADGGASTSEVNAMLASLPKYGFNLAAARHELARSPYPHGFTTEVQATVSEPILVQAAQIFASDLAKIGINAKVDALPADEFGEMYGKRVKLLLNEFWAFWPEPDVFMEDILSPANIEPPGDGNNWAAYRNSEVAKLLTEERGMENPQQRLQVIGRILHIVGEELPYVPMFAHGNFATLSDKYVDPLWSTYSAFYSPWALDVKLAR